MTVPSNWYNYDWPLEYSKNAATPSKADYSPENVAPLIEFFASVIGKDKSEVQFRYENNTSDPSKAITVNHPNDQEYLPAYVAEHAEKSPEQIRYEEAAKGSARLKLFQDNSPAGIEYFK